MGRRAGARATVSIAVSLIMMSGRSRAADDPSASSNASRSDGPRSEAEPLFLADAGLGPRELILRALRENRDLAAMRLEVVRAQARLRQARLAANPTLEVARSRGLGSQHEDAVSVSIPIPIFGRRSTAIAAAQAAVALAEAEVRERERQIVSATLGAHADLLALAQSLDLGAQLRSVNVDLRRLIEARVREADAPALDLRLLDVELQRLDARQTMARARASAQSYTLRTLLGLTEAQPLLLRKVPAAPEYPGVVGSVEDVVGRVLEHRPDMRAARAAQDLAVAELERARAESRPEVSLFGRYSSKTASATSARDAERLIGGGLSVSLPILNRGQGTIAAAEATVRQAAIHRDAVEGAARAEIASALVRFDAARRAIALYESLINPGSRLNLDTLREAYSIGAIPLGEVLNEQRRLIEANNEFATAIAEAYRAAADLQVATGEGLP